MPKAVCSFAIGIALTAATFLSPVTTISAHADESIATQQVEVGQPAPDFTLPDPDGSDHSASGLRGEMNLLLVFFRGAW